HQGKQADNEHNIDNHQNFEFLFVHKYPFASFLHIEFTSKIKKNKQTFRNLRLFYRKHPLF
ncbi:MAG: hypothetical protein J6T54_04040, partial [Fibrobacter sp.]|nr:hypothetical protein [Fibrobacter sp.]